MTVRLSRDLAVALLDTAVSWLETPYPARSLLLLRSPGDLLLPADAHPAFHGAYDWHSSVHAQWTVLRLLRTRPDLAGAGRARGVIASRLRPAALAAEASFLSADPTFERPYGWAWVLALATEVGRSDLDDPAARAAVADLAAVVMDLVGAWLPGATYPLRAGTQANSAFFLLLALRHARATSDARFEERLVAAARRWYLHDVAAPTAYEPSGEDFLSPTLVEAHLMGEVLAADDFSDWFDAFLPGVADVIPASLREPVAVVDPEDPRLVHLSGLALSRAWNWRGIAYRLPARDPRRVAALDAADRHRAGQLDGRPGGVVGASPAGGHWLSTFALLAAVGL